MITSWVIEIILSVVGAVVNLLPVGDVSSNLVISGGAAATDMVGWLGVLSGFVPVVLAVQLLEVSLVVVLPVVLIVLTVEWAWTHLPTFFGIGT